jgi:hypothetical protein
MRHSYYALGLLVFLLPAVSRAADDKDAPEQLLSANSQIYMRWDGIEAHRAAYDKTAIGKMMKGDTGVFVTGVFGQLQESIGSLLTVNQLLTGTPPDKLQQLQKHATESGKLLPLLADHGFILAVEARGIEPPEGQITIILPDAGSKSAPVLGALNLIAGLNKLELKELKVGETTVHTINLGAVHVTFWIQGKHAVLTIGTDDAEKTVKTMTAGNHARLASTELFKRVHGFDKFETGARAYIDVAAITKLANTRGKDVEALMTELGVDNLKSIVFYSGFDGASERSILEMETPGPRKGLLTLLSGKPFKLGDVPPMPPDVSSWSMTNLDAAKFYDVLVPAAERIAGMIAPDGGDDVKGFTKKIDEFLGIDLRKDLLGSLDNQFVQYTSPSEGPVNLGQTYLFKVKDQKKLEEALEQAIKGLSKLTTTEVKNKKRIYKGVEVHEVHFGQQSFPVVPTYAIHEGWLVIGYYPPAVHGYIARSKKEMGAWKPTPKTEEALKLLPQEFISVSYSDPRPSIRTLLSIAPVIGATINSFSPEFNFDIGTLPNAQDATRHLFPNVSVTTDDGKVLRVETRASLALPIELTGLDTYAILLLLSSHHYHRPGAGDETMLVPRTFCTPTAAAACIKLRVASPSAALSRRRRTRHPYEDLHRVPH